ncbi:hypothetical protein OZN62_11715 [Aurantiacibacter sp. MUD11]|uniref:hypothetical protein n=1 Tax=Aurantiacibacter sp. MUD11 TaxID=3003265 RepID=UPI0022AAC527|nr:hypothetical protein [Aurantiacibacter sp. MUD11]WAT17580.1 hypothetical protein OZN62_11715 [Aurantiacibacter sp. MUD11]
MRKIAILALATVLAIGSASQAFSNAVADSQPAIAAQLSPFAARPQQKLATSLIEAGAEDGSLDVSAALPHAEAALDNDLLATEALAVMALAQDDPAARNTLVDAALAVSRRGRVLNSAALVAATANGDTDTLLAALNRSLLLYPSQKEAMIPLLVEQLADDRMAPAFIPLLDTNPDWAEEFWVAVGAREELAQNAATVRLGLAPESAVSRESDRAILRLLSRTGRLQEAAQVYARLRGEQQLPAQTGSLGWQNTYVPFDWQFYDVGGRFARPASDGESLTISVRAGYGGVLARRLVRLDGSTSFFEVTHSLDPASTSRVRLTLECPDSDARWSDTFSRSPTGMRVDVPMPCEYAWLGIEARATAGSQNISGQILDIKRM